MKLLQAEVNSSCSNKRSHSICTIFPTSLDGSSFGNHVAIGTKVDAATAPTSSTGSFKPCKIYCNTFGRNFDSKS